MDDRQAFLLAILEDPGEANPLVFADWLHDHGEEEPALVFRQARGPIVIAWAVIHDWLARHHPTMLASLNGPADEAAFVRLEERVGQVLPEDFKASYRLHDGSAPESGVLIGLPLMSLEEVAQAWEVWADVANDGYTVEDLSEYFRSHPPGAVKPLYANRNWVPFAGDSQNHIALDFDPGPEGTPGQVINCGRDDEVRHVIAGTFAGLLTFVARQFVLGRVCAGKDPRWLAVAGGKRELLTGLRGLLGLEGPEKAE
jgi:uncharacterized protein (TIGR02996 family)